MISVQKQMRTRRAIASTMLALLSFVGAHSALAEGTAASTPVNNRATVNYSVLGTPQTLIESSPLGNSTPGVGAGANTTFVVDNRIDLTVDEEDGANTAVRPGQANAFVMFRVTNDGNAPQGFTLTATNEAGSLFGNADNADFNPLPTFVDANDNDTYDPGVDNATHIDTLAADADVAVFVVVNVPLTATNGQFVNVRLEARAALPGTNGGTPATETAGADTAGVDVVFGDTGEDALESDLDQFAVRTAALVITKTSDVISDPFNGVSVDAKAIPGAVVEYIVTVQNNGAVDAEGVSLSDTIDGNVAFEQGQYPGAMDVQIQVGAAPATFCVAEDGPDATSDGCTRTGATLTVNPTVPVVVPAGQSATVRFRVSIN